MIMTGVSLVSIGMLTPSCARFRDAKNTSDTYTYESDDIRVTEIPKELQFLDVHYQVGHHQQFEERAESHLVLTCVQLPSELCDGHFPAFQLANEHVFESTAPDLGQLNDLVRRNLPIM